MGTGEKVDEVNLQWETKWIDLLINYDLPEGVKLYKKVARRFVFYVFQIIDLD